ncbi:MAG TPA: polysaccharide biosynthesis tyrosine autokinase [Phycisphaerae bacterium]|nr:polysaccharide biosynthesis tyrosine autokinase [Phycisphaerae bacterium]
MSYDTQRQTASNPVGRPVGAAVREPAAQSGVLSLGEVLGTMRRHMVLIIVLFVLIAGAGAAVTVYQYRNNPVYEASGTVVVLPAATGGQQQGIVGTVEQALPVGVLESFINEQVQRIREDYVLQKALSPEIAEKIINDLARDTERIDGGGERDRASMDAADERVRQRTAYIQEQLFPEGRAPSVSAMVVWLQEELQVTNPFKTFSIEVKLRGRNKKLVTSIVNSVLESYMVAYRERRRRNEQSSLTGLQEQLDSLLPELRKAETALASERELAVTPYVGMDRPNIASEVQYYEGEFAKADLEVFQLQVLQAQMTGAAGAEGAEGAEPAAVKMTPELQLTMESDRALAALRGAMTNLKSSREMLLKQGYGKTHQSVLAVDAQIASAEMEVKAREDELLDLLYRQQSDSIAARLAEATQRRNQIKSKLDDAKSRLREVTTALVRYDRLQQAYLNIQRQVDVVNDAIVQQRIRAQVSSNNVQIGREAMEPDETDIKEPNLLLYIPASILAGLVVAVGMALLIDLIDNRVRTPLQVIRNVQMTVLGTVPDAKEDEAARRVGELARVAAQAPQSLTAESFRQLRTALMYSSDTELKTLLVTSPKADEGKTVVACNLAATLAASGCRVLLIDANFRRPRIHRVFDLPNTVGLSSVLARLSSVEESVRSTSVANLDVLVCGPVPPSPADLLGSEAMQNVLAEARQRYDNVIIDGTPVLVVADSHVLCRLVDGVTMVINCRKTSRGMAMRSRRMLMGFRARVVGAVLNRIRAQKGGYFRETYRNYYDYAKPTAGAATAASRASSSPSARSADTAALDELSGPGSGGGASKAS